MFNIWLIYNFALIFFIFGSSLTSASTLPQYLLPLLLVPSLIYLGKEIKRKSRRHVKLDKSAAFQSDLTLPARTVLEGTEEAETGQILGSNISDDNRRLFLKLIGSTSLSIFFMAVLGKKSASAAFFGSVPGPGTVAVKNIAGETIDPAEKQSTDGYEISQVDDASTPSYYGFVHKTGAWYITKEDATGAYRYWKGSSGFSAAWDLRADPLTVYGYFDSVF